MQKTKFQYPIRLSRTVIGIWHLIFQTFKNSYAVLGKALLLNTSKIPTPVDIAISATLKIALKKETSSPPQIGNQDGKTPFQIGK